MEVCDSRDQLSVIKYCRKRVDLRCDKVPGLPSDYLLCLGYVLSIKVHQFWCFSFSPFSLIWTIILPKWLTLLKVTWHATPRHKLLWRAIIVHRNIKIFMCRMWRPNVLQNIEIFLISATLRGVALTWGKALIREWHFFNEACARWSAY